MALRANVLAKGFSGIRRRDARAAARPAQPPACIRVVPSRGSVGASGDLAPLAHLALVLIGEGRRERGATRRLRSPDAEALETAGPRPGAARGQGGAGADQRHAAVDRRRGAGARRRRAPRARRRHRRRRCRSTRCAGSVHPFDARIHDAAAASPASRFRPPTCAGCSTGSAINKSHEHCGRIQDAYSLRCAAQVHGAAREALGVRALDAVTEANAATDNPMVFADEGEIVSGGNFHGAPVAVAADLLAIALAQLATISERRSDRLVNPALSELPAFLTPNSGLQSGYMMAQVTAAALASEIKTLAHPASVDTIPTSANREDHVSMSMGAALKAERALSTRDARRSPSRSCARARRSTCSRR